MNYEDNMLVSENIKLILGVLIFLQNEILRTIEEKYLSSLQVFAIVNFFIEYLKKK